jgi:copper chaperone CopZ
MKNSFLAVALVLGLAAFSARAEDTVKISEVHLCCNSCVKGVDKAVGKVAGLTATVDKDAETVTLSAANKATLQKGADALTAAGYFGVSSDPAIKLVDASGAKDAKVKSMTVNDVHLCCGKCVTAVDKALKSVKGVESHTAEKGAKSFEVKGDFNQKEAMTALQKAGLTGTASN